MQKAQFSFSLSWFCSPKRQILGKVIALSDMHIVKTKTTLCMCTSAHIRIISTIFTLTIQTTTPYHTCPNIWTSPYDYLLMCLQTAGWVADSVDPDQMLQSAASDLGLHCLLRLFYWNIMDIVNTIQIWYLPIYSFVVLTLYRWIEELWRS